MLLTPPARTPLVPVVLEEGQAPVWCKLEFLNPSGSTKDRVASYVLLKAWQRGEIGPGSLVVEASSGSTSIALALVCAQMGLRFLAVMPEGVSRERTLMIRAYGGEVVLSNAADGIRGALAMARKLARERGGFETRQFENPDSAAAHREGTAREIVEEIPGSRVDGVVSGVGTGGTIVGLYEGMRERGCDAVPFVVRPVSRTRRDVTATGCFAEAECCSFSPRIPGVVENVSTLFVPARLEGLVQIEIDDAVAIETTRALIRRGLPVGPSSGLNYAAARAAQRRLGGDAVVVTVLPDRMERYFSTPLFDGFEASRVPAPLQRARETHAGEHRDEEGDHGRLPRRERGHSGSRAEADEPPADAEKGRAEEQGSIDPTRRGQRERAR
jgi:cysteine synthase A